MADTNELDKLGTRPLTSRPKLSQPRLRSRPPRRLVPTVALELVAIDAVLVVRPVAPTVSIVLAVSLRRKRSFLRAGTPALGLCTLKDADPKCDIQSPQGFGFGLAFCLIPQTHGILETRLEKGELFLRKQGLSEACEEALDADAAYRLW